ncbi:DUF4416 family protein [Desulfomicrobium baculatum]|uniref:GTP-binding protein n=1 Tax=Desulfomicrobium baculatum (strain DSM 4028 / VKM B-1378 / X) TaxID=525897 RepID=C7LUQ9_DESBD|nr:DUF4416 family protein [Desulfomicrobium baculatum]ACU90974.1 GTP-binding protein [Desulfomicrobium baculatum DSM 4028]
MSIPILPLPGRAFLSVLSARHDEFRPMLRPRLEEILGPIDYESQPIPFNRTSYYDSELGTPISRHILSFERPLPLDGLAEVKLATNRLEAEWALDGRRLFNLDPGYVTQERLVLATGKNFTHRVYLSQGIWADLTLIFQGGDWLDLPWTFPDYAAPAVKTHLTRIREMYRDSLKHLTSLEDTPCPKV